MRKTLIAALACAAVSGCMSSPAPTASSNFFDGYNALKRADYATAERSLSRALASNPNDAYANLSMGSVMHQTNRPAEAQRYYQAAIANGEDVYGARTYEARPNDEKMLAAGPGPSVADLARQNLALF